MKGTLDVHCALLSRDIPHEILRLPRMVLTADEIPDVLGVPARRCLAVHGYDVDGRLVGLLLPVDVLPDLAALRATLHAHRVRPAEPAVVNAVTDYAAGLVPPLPLPDQVILLADPGLLPRGVVYTPTGDVGTVLGIESAQLLGAARPRLVEVTGANTATQATVGG